MNYMDKLRAKKIAVLYGGISGEREVSLRSGKKFFDSIISQGLNAILVDTKEDFIQILKDKKIDLAAILLHGIGGEDGSIQGLLEIMGINYTGSKVLASALAMDKVASKRIWENLNIPTPKYIAIDKKADLKNQCDFIEKTFPFPLVLKPNKEGSSLGISIVKDKKDVYEYVKDAFKKFDEMFVEEFIEGVQVTVGIIEENGTAKALPILELNPKSEFYDFKAKYTDGMTEFIIPARLPKAVYTHTQEMAIKAFKALGCSGFARIDAIVDKDGTPFFHDANTIPGMTDLSDLPAQAKADGISYDELAIKLLKSAI